MKNEKIEINYVRAVAILAVVMIHTASFYTWFTKTHYINWYFVYHQLTSFAVPSFICISGIVLTLKYKDKELDYQNFLKNRMVNIIIPYLVANILYMIYTKDIWTKPMEYIAQLIFTGQAFFHLYFVIIIVQLYILYPVFRYITLKIKSILWFVPLLLIQHYIYKSFNNAFPFIAQYFRASFFMRWIFIFLIGCYIGQNYDLYKYYVSKYINGMIGFIGSFILYKVINYHYTVFYLKKARFWEYSQVETIDNMIYTLLIISLIVHFADYINKDIINNILQLLSKNSYGIYLYHMFVLRFFKYVIELYEVKVNNIIILLILAITLAVTVIFTTVVNKIPFGYLIVGKNK